MPKVPRPKNSSRTRRQKCRLCNHLDPREHASTFFNDKAKATAHLTLSIDVAQLKRVCEGGCRFCLLICQALDKSVSEWRRRGGSIGLDIVEQKPVILRVQGQDSDPIVLQIYSPLTGHAEPSAWNTIGRALELPPHPDADESYQFIDDCIQKCLKHKLCQLDPSKILPARLLDIGEGENEPIRITSPRKARFEYIALSHCWGTGPTLTTTTYNISQHKDEIKWEDLPVLFADAIQISRRLGVRFIWIDSLCILQDCKHDWERESAKMGAIFENAYLVISAVECLNSGQRILAPRPNQFRRRKLTYKNTTGSEFKLHVRRYHEHHPDVEENMPAHFVGPLMTRAWAQQEQILATRILHYTATELVFECKTAVCCECRPHSAMRPSNPSLLAHISQTAHQSSITFRRKAHAKWHHLLNLYSLRNLSHSCDKLPAISGIAEKFKMATGSVYMAGLWLDNLVPDLLWSSMPYLQDPHHSHRLSEYRAPSWSWASVDTQFQYEDMNEERGLRSLVTIKSVNCETSGLNPLGEVNGGILVLVGSIVHGTLIAPAKHEFYYHLKLSGPTSIEVSPDTLLMEQEASNILPRTVRRAKDGDEYKPFSVSITCLAVMTTSDDCVYGVVLGQTSSEKYTFLRLGLFTCGNSAFGKGEKREISIV